MRVIEVNVNIIVKIDTFKYAHTESPFEFSLHNSNMADITIYHNISTILV